MLHRATLPCLLLAMSVVAGAWQGPNSDPTYQKLRNPELGPGVTVNNVVLKRAEAILTLKSGTVCLLAPVDGKVTGAVFVGSGSFVMEPTSRAEQHNIALLTKSESLHEDFNELMLRFSDGAEKELTKGATAGGSCDNGPLHSATDAFRHKLHYNVAARLLEDVLSPEPGGFFVALIKGQHYSGKMLFVVDPYGSFIAAPDQVALMTYDETKFGVWVAYNLGATRGQRRFSIEKQNLDTKIESNARLNGNAATTIVAQSKDLRVPTFDLYPSLRVQKVTDDGGQPLSFIQEDKDDDPQYAVILPRGLGRGEKLVVHTQYAGKDAIVDLGNSNYFPIARSDWYPNSFFGEYENYEMRFSIPKGLTIVATGTRLSETVDGNQNVTTWKSEVPQAVAGFTFGMFKRMEAQMPQQGYVVESYANEMLPDNISRGIGAMSTVAMMKKPLAEAQVAVGLYTDYFGPAPYKRVAMTQQFACNFGQSWPTLVYLPLCSFLDTTQRHFMGLDDTRGYWQVVAPHEVAHQWWGHTVGFASYRDQWMSEGFAELSASLFVQYVNASKGPAEFLKFWKDERDLLTERNKEGWRAIDAGPLTMGYRLANDKAGFDIPRRLIYPKGGYVLHMIRMMMWDPKTGDADFKAMMHDFVQTYANRAATTEDFKAMVEKHMTPALNAAAGNHSMDWFFKQYVYGTALPAYKLETTMTNDAKGPNIHVAVTQSNVTPDFRMPVPVYVELSNGHVAQLGRLLLVGNSTVTQDVPLQTANQVKRVLINYYADVLSTEGK